MELLCYKWNAELLTGSSRSDINMAVHQTSRFNNNPTWQHEKDIMRICRYLVGTKDRRMVSRPEKYKVLEFFVDAVFTRNWQNASEDHPDNCL